MKVVAGSTAPVNAGMVAGVSVRVTGTPLIVAGTSTVEVPLRYGRVRPGAAVEDAPEAVVPEE